MNNVAELLPVARAAARIWIKHHVSLGSHPLKFVVKDKAISQVGAAMNVQDEWIFFCSVKVRRLLYPRMNLFAIKTGVPDLFWRCDVELGEKLVIDVGQLARLSAGLCAVNPEQIADIRRRGDERNQSRCVFICAKAFYRLIATRDF